MKKSLLILVALLTAMTVWAGSSSTTKGTGSNRDVAYNYTFDSETGELALLYGEFSKDDKWGSEVSPSAVKSVTATGNVSFVGDCSELFKDFNNCTSMELNSVFTREATNMSKMFQGCSSLTTLEISDWNTENATNMSSMFDGCGRLTSLDISDWNTENVTDMSYMFQTCFSLSSLNISNWNTANVTNMSNMFSSCGDTYAPPSLDLSGWDTGNVTNMNLMFYACRFSSLNLSGWDLSKVGYLGSIFSGSTYLTSLDLSGWNTSNVTLITNLFLSCTFLKTINLAGWDISKVTGMGGMFLDCHNLTTIYASTSWYAGNVPANYTTNMFNNCTSLVGGMGTTFDSNYTDKTYARIDRGTEQPGYFTGVFALTLPQNVTASPNPVCTLGGTGYFKAGSTVTLTYNGNVPEGKMVIYNVNGAPIEGNTFPMPLDDVTVTVTFRNLPIQVTVGDITFNMIKVDGNDDISTFYIGECEVTEALWQAVMGNNPSSYQGNLADYLPVENISWNDCQEFIAKLKQMTKLNYRLPTSTEWLFAASGGNDTHGYTYSGSNTIGDVAWYNGNCSQKMTVGTKAPNELGIHDMSGNVYEIIQEATGVYGGGWHAPAGRCKVTYYWPADEEFTDNDTGFRLALTNFDEIPAVVGDVNGDGSVTSADVTCIYNYLLNGDESFIDTCDVDGDGYITSSDITVIYNILLGGK
ncbi:MAG: BspA family leucine-rich repeat surface protein [Muribaculaceae bacterium]|nr:BspA family leucine-rich repeat surface protein [Muribaculaceae bacterium]